MTQSDISADQPSEPTEGAASLRRLPAGWTLSRVAFVAAPDPHLQVLFAFPAPLNQKAVLLPAGADVPTDATNTIEVLLIPATAEAVVDDATISQVEAWLDAAPLTNGASSLRMTLQAARIFWRPGRLALVAPADRLIAMRDAILTAAFLDGELAAIEESLAAAWSQLEADGPHAFEFTAAALAQRRRLRERFQEVLLLRARLARLSPLVHAPHLHPPTLASQASERFGDRTRLTQRHEFLDEQLQVFERVYENCGQRVSDLMLTRSGNTLEWIIILLLLAQTLLLVFELLSNTTQ